MTLIVESPASPARKPKHFSMVVLGNGPAFLQTILMLKDRDILPVTNNDADLITLERLGARPMKKEFQSSVLSFVGENNYQIVLVSSTSHSRQIIRALASCLRTDQVLLIVRYPKLRKIWSHPYTFVMDTTEQFDRNLWHRCLSLHRMAMIHEFIKSRLQENQKILKMLIIFFGPPDPDAIASSLAFTKLFSKKTAVTYASTDKVKRFENRALLSYLKISVQDLSSIELDDFSVIACLDSQPDFFKKSGYDIPFDICIDHHPESDGNPPLAISDIRRNHGSCSTILAQYYYYSKKALPKSLATALLFGMKSDTVNFTRSVHETDARMMTFLYRKADHEILKKFEFSKIPKRTLKYFKRAYGRFIHEGSVLICHLGKVGYLDIGSIIAEHFLKIQGVYLTMVSCIYRDRMIVFFRSVNDMHHAGRLASQFFGKDGVGGGHAEMGRAECLLGRLPFPQKEAEKTLHAFSRDHTREKT